MQFEPDDTSAVELGVSDFVALLNQTLEMAYANVVITGELANFRISKNKWVYFDLKDELSSVKFFGTIYNLPGPLEDGMILKVRGQPRLHPLYGFSVTVMSMRPAGEGTIRRAAQLLQAKLTAEGLFDTARKRPLPYPPSRIGLTTSKQSAAYADFVKILNARWRGLDIQLIDVQVQGEPAPAQITAALEQFNTEAEAPEVIIIIRGGGSAEDLAAFSTEQVTRAVASSRVPTLVAIGHEVDWSLAELAADQRASTPSNAAELLVPDRTQTMLALKVATTQLQQAGQVQLRTATGRLEHQVVNLQQGWLQTLQRTTTRLQAQQQLLAAVNPTAILRRGYAIVRQAQQSVRSVSALQTGAIVDVQVSDGRFSATVTKLKGTT
jgi:exodeoxyribonuclease VII large subunit